MRNLESRNTPMWVLPNIWRLKQVKDTKGCLSWKVTECCKMSGYSFTISKLLRENQQGGNTPPHRLGLKNRKPQDIMNRSSLQDFEKLDHTHVRK